MVLLHGFGASSSHWRHNAAPLTEAGYRVYGLDLIGFGRSEQPGLDSHIRLDNRLWGAAVGSVPGAGGSTTRGVGWQLLGRTYRAHHRGPSP